MESYFTLPRTPGSVAGGTVFGAGGRRGVHGGGEWTMDEFGMRGRAGVGAGEGGGGGSRSTSPALSTLTQKRYDFSTLASSSSPSPFSSWSPNPNRAEAPPRTMPDSSYISDVSAIGVGVGGMNTYYTSSSSYSSNHSSNSSSTTTSATNSAATSPTFTYRTAPHPPYVAAPSANSNLTPSSSSSFNSLKEPTTATRDDFTPRSSSVERTGRSGVSSGLGVAALKGANYTYHYNFNPTFNPIPRSTSAAAANNNNDNSNSNPYDNDSSSSSSSSSHPRNSLGLHHQHHTSHSSSSLSQLQQQQQQQQQHFLQTHPSSSSSSWSNIPSPAPSTSTTIATSHSSSYSVYPRSVPTPASSSGWNHDDLLGPKKSLSTSSSSSSSSDSMVSMGSTPAAFSRSSSSSSLRKRHEVVRGHREQDHQRQHGEEGEELTTKPTRESNVSSSSSTMRRLERHSSLSSLLEGDDDGRSEPREAESGGANREGGGGDVLSGLPDLPSTVSTSSSSSSSSSSLQSPSQSRSPFTFSNIEARRFTPTMSVSSAAGAGAGVKRPPNPDRNDSFVSSPSSSSNAAGSVSGEFGIEGEDVGGRWRGGGGGSRSSLMMRMMDGDEEGEEQEQEQGSGDGFQSDVFVGNEHEHHFGQETLYTSSASLYGGIPRGHDVSPLQWNHTPASVSVDGVRHYHHVLPSNVPTSSSYAFLSARSPQVPIQSAPRASVAPNASASNSLLSYGFGSFDSEGGGGSGGANHSQLGLSGFGGPNPGRGNESFGLTRGNGPGGGGGGGVGRGGNGNGGNGGGGGGGGSSNPNDMFGNQMGSTTTEEISTIFVVGFPDDMQEREFQNMFTFCPGFEAATLKVPASTVAARERDAVVNAVANATPALKAAAVAAAAAAMPPSSNPYGGMSLSNVPVDPYTGLPMLPHGNIDSSGYEDTFGNLPLDGPASALGHVLGQSLAGRNQADPGGQANSTRKQIIGFAKFRTRIEALAARDILSGRKVDAEKGSVLKAEMAKKNLHTKRGLSNDPSVTNSLVPSMSAASLVAAAAASGGALPPGLVSAMGPAYYSAALEGQQALYATGMMPPPPPPPPPPPQTGSIPPTAPGGGAVHAPIPLRQREPSQNPLQTSAAFDAFHSVPGSGPQPLFAPAQSHRHPIPHEMPSEAFSPSGIGRYLPLYGMNDRHYALQDRVSPPEAGGSFDLGQSPTSSTSATSSSPILASSIPSARGKSLLQQLDDGSDDLPNLSSLTSEYPPSNSNTPFQATAAENDFRGENKQQLPSSSSLSSEQLAYYNSLEEVARSSVLGQYPGQSHPLSGGRQGSQSGGSGGGGGGGLSSRLSNLSLNTSSPPLHHEMPSGLTSPTFPRTHNPADANPPISTLYVGGLPAVLPSLTGPLSASSLEDNLRGLFSRCAGFKRLCFRQKSNGIMAFVEFDDVHYASRAITELYGHTLGGIVKGGIRLSYSKNPLGVRSTGPSSNPGSGATSPGPISPPGLGPGADAVFSLSSTPTPSQGPQSSSSGTGSGARRMSETAPPGFSAPAFRAISPPAAAGIPAGLAGGGEGFAPFALIRE